MNQTTVGAFTVPEFFRFESLSGPYTELGFSDPEISTVNGYPEIIYPIWSGTLNPEEIVTSRPSSMSLSDKDSDGLLDSGFVEINYSSVDAVEQTLRISLSFSPTSNLEVRDIQLGDDEERTVRFIDVEPFMVGSKRKPLHRVDLLKMGAFELPSIKDADGYSLASILTTNHIESSESVVFGNTLIPLRQNIYGQKLLPINVTGSGGTVKYMNYFGRNFKIKTDANGNRIVISTGNRGLTNESFMLNGKQLTKNGDGLYLAAVSGTISESHHVHFGDTYLLINVVNGIKCLAVSI